MSDSPELEGMDPENNPIPKKRRLRAPSKETMQKLGKAGAVVGGVLFTGSKLALGLARRGINVTSKVANAISKSELFEEAATTLLTVGASVAVLPVAGTIGVVNKILLGKNANFAKHARNGYRTAHEVAKPLVNGVLAPLLGLGTKAIDKATEKSLAERISDATGGQIPPEMVGSVIKARFANMLNRGANPRSNDANTIDDENVIDGIDWNYWQNSSENQSNNDDIEIA